MTVGQQIEILQAYDAGKIVEFTGSDLHFWKAVEPGIVDYEFNFEKYLYRVSDKPEFRPFKDFNELNEVKGSMPWVRKGEESLAYLITEYETGSDMIFVGDVPVTFGMLLDRFTFLDGTLCGVRDGN